MRNKNLSLVEICFLFRVTGNANFYLKVPFLQPGKQEIWHFYHHYIEVGQTPPPAVKDRAADKGGLPSI